MTHDEMPAWERLEGGRDFRAGMRLLSQRGERRLYHPIDAGDYVVSVQASAEHDSTPRSAAHPYDVQAWEVAVFRDERLLSEAVDPELAELPFEWRRYWTCGIGRNVPTEILQVVLHRLTLGPDAFDRFVLREPD